MAYRATIDLSSWSAGINQMKSDISNSGKGMASGIESELGKAESAVAQHAGGMKDKLATIGTPTNLAGGIEKDLGKAESVVTQKTGILGGLFSKIGLGASSGMDVSKASAKMSQDLEVAAGKMQKNFVAQSGYMGQLASAAGPVGIASAVIIGFGVACEVAAEKNAKLMKSVADATGIEVGSEQYNKLTDQLQQNRMNTGIGAEMETSAASTAGGMGVDLSGISDEANSLSIWASKWKADVKSLGEDIGALGNAAKAPQESWSQFTDKLADSADILSKKYQVSATDIISSTTRLAPAFAKLKLPESAIPDVMAFSTAINKIDPAMTFDRINKGINDMVSSLSKSSTKVDMAKVLGIDSSTLDTQLQTNFVGTIEKLSQKIMAIPDPGLRQKLLGELGSGKDIAALAGTEQGITKINEAVTASSTAFNSGKSASDQWGQGLAAGQVQMDRFTQILGVMMEKIGTPFVGAAGGFLKGVNDYLEGIVTVGDKAVDVLKSVASGGGGIGLSVDKNGLLGQMGLGGDWNIDWSGIHKGAVDAGKDAAKTAADTIKTDPSLATSLGDGLSSEEAMTASRDAADKAAQEFTKAYGSQFEAGMTLINNKWVSNQDSAAGIIPTIGKTSIVGFDFVIDSNYDLKTPTGVEHFSSSADWASRGPSVMKAMLGRSMTAIESAELYGDIGAQIKLKAAVKVDSIFDLAPALKGMDAFAPQLEGKFTSVMGSVAANMQAYSKPQMEATGKALITALAAPISLEGWSTVKACFDTLQAQMGPGTASIFGDLAAKATDAYKAKLLSGIADAGTFVKDSMTTIGKEAQTAFSDGYISDSEKTMLLGLQPQLDLLKQECPAQFKATGGDTIQAMIDAIKAGDLPGAMAAIGKLSGQDFKENVLGGMSEVIPSIAQIFNDPSLRSQIKDPLRYYTGLEGPAIEQALDDINTKLKTGMYTADQADSEFISQMVKNWDLLPPAIQKYTKELLTIDPATHQGMISIQQYTALVKAYDASLAGATSTTQKAIPAITTYDAACKQLTSTHAQLSGSLETLNTQWKDGKISNDQYQTSIITVANDSLPKAKVATDAYGSSVDRITQTSLPGFNSGLDTTNAKLRETGTNIAPLAEISGKGIEVKFSPANVVADDAKTRLIEGTDYFKNAMTSSAAEITGSLAGIAGIGAALKQTAFGTTGQGTYNNPKANASAPASTGYSQADLAAITGNLSSGNAYSVPLVSSSSTSASQAVPVVIMNTASNPTTSKVISNPYDAVTMNYAGSPWLKDYGTTPQDFVKISSPTAQFASPAKGGSGFGYSETGQAPIDYLAPEQTPLGSVDRKALEAYYNSLNLSLKPTGDLASNVHDLYYAAQNANPAVTKTNSQLDSTKSQLIDLGNGVYKLTNPIPDACVSSDYYNKSLTMQDTMFKQTSITFNDKLTPAQRAAYEGTANLATKMKDVGLCVTDTAGFSQNLMTALDKTDTSFVGSTADYERLGLGLKTNSVHVGTMGQGVTVLGDSASKTGVTVGGLDKNVVQLGSSADHGTIAIGTFSRVITEIDPAIQAMANTIVGSFKAVTQEAIDGARAQADEYGQLTLGTDAVINSLVKLTAENGKFCEAISDFGLAQENTLGIFQQSYIGPTSGYDQFKQLDAAIAKAAGQTIKSSQIGGDQTIKSSQIGGDYITQSGAQAGQSLDNSAYGFFNMSQAAATSILNSAQGAAAANQATWTSINGSQVGIWAGITGQALNTSNQVRGQQVAASNQTNAQNLQSATSIGALNLGSASAINANNQGSAVAINATNQSTWMSIGGSAVENWTSINGSTTSTYAGINTTLSSTFDSVCNNIRGASDYFGSTIAASAGGSYTSGSGGSGGTYKFPTRSDGSWGGTSVNGGGSWIGTSGTQGGINGGTYYGCTFGNGNVSWGGAAASNAASNGGGSGGYGSVQWATGGIVDKATAGIFGEAGREALVPLDDRAAGWNILRQILPEFGIQPFADGGIVGRSGVNNFVINTNTQSKSDEKETLVIVVDMSGKEIGRQIAKGNNKRLKLKIGRQ